LVPVHTLILGLTLSPGAKISNSLLQVANETTHRLRNSCGMTIAFCINGATNPESAEIGEVPLSCFYFFSCVLFWPIFSSLSVSTRLVLLDPSATFFLLMVVPLAEVTKLSVSIIVHCLCFFEPYHFTSTPPFV
jgi:hypothetical protein